ncbi:MAG: prepilin peptidase [Planctomycetota bacterium]
MSDQSFWWLLPRLRLDRPSTMLRRRPIQRIAVWIVGGYVMVAMAYVIAFSALVIADDPTYRFSQIVLPRSNDVALLTFFLVVGGSVGSFLNVVAWRLPRSRSLNGHSHCPHCDQRLRARDNVPVLGWLWLEGRCRSCRLPISPRYPIVEAVVAISFAVIGVAEFYRWNLPYQPLYPHRGPMFTPRVDDAVLMTLVYHFFAIALAWAAALIRFDGHALPRGLVAFAGITLIGGMLIFPPAAIVPWQMSEPSGWPPTTWWDAGGLPASECGVQLTVRIISALAAAGFLGRVLAKSLCPAADLKLSPLGSPTRRLLDLIAMLGIVAVVVGWQATPAVLFLASIMATQPIAGRVRIRVRGQRLDLARTDPLARLAMALPVALVIQLLFWRPLIATGIWPSEAASRGVMLLALLSNLMIPVWLRQTDGHHHDVSVGSDVD